MGDGEVRAVSKQGGAIDLLASGAYFDAIARGADQLVFADASSIWTLVDGDPSPAPVAATWGPTWALAVVGDASSGTLAWSTHQASPPHQVFAGPLPAAGALATPSVVVDLSDTSAPAAVAVDASALFYADGSNVHAVDANGDTLLYAASATVDALTASAGSVWFVADGRIQRATPGAAASAVSFAPGAVGRVAVDGDVYWAVDATDGAPMIWKLDPRGSVSVVVHAGGGEEPGPRGLAVDASCVYWIATAEGRIYRSAR